MAEWRALRGWTESELEQRLAALAERPRSFPDALADRLVEAGFEPHVSQAVVGMAPPGPPLPGGPFLRLRDAVAAYAFSDPRIVVAHFDPRVPLLQRRMLLELRVLGLRFLCGVVVSEVEACEGPEQTCFAFRYDTLAGHVENGSEWFVLTQEHATGEIVFRIEAAWRIGDLPNGWSRLGFILLARRYQEDWHRLAYQRLRRIAGAPRGTLAQLPRRGRLIHAGGEWPDASSRWRFPEVSRGAPVAHPQTRAVLVAAIGYGAMAGVRSASAPAALSRAFARRAPPSPRRQPARMLSHPRVARALAIAAVGELVADKTGRLPPRTGPMSLAGRFASGAFSGAALARTRSAGGRALPALVGAASAGLSAMLAYRLRHALTRRVGWPDLLVALAEDAGVVVLARTLRRAGAP